MSWNNPPAEVKILSRMVVEGETSVREVQALYQSYESGSLDVSPHEMFSALEEPGRDNLPTLVHILYEDEAYGASWASISRYVATHRLSGMFPWEKDRTYEDTTADDVVDSNVSDEDILTIAEGLDAEGMAMMGELPDAVIDEHIPDDLPDEMAETVRSLVSSKCARVVGFK